MGRALMPVNLGLAKFTKSIRYLLPEQVYQVAEAIKQSRNGERDHLLVLTLYQLGTRISETLRIAPNDLEIFEGSPVVRILGKGGKVRLVSCPQRLADRLKSFCYTHKIKENERIFQIGRKQAWVIIRKAAERTGIDCHPHTLRHSSAVERLKQSRHLKSLQHHLGHARAGTTLVYLSTLEQQDSLRIQKEVQFPEFPEER